MSDTDPRIAELEARSQHLRQQLAQIGDLRPGSLVGRYRKCGKPSCHCARPGAKGHGPSWSLTRRVRGKTITKIVPSGPAVERTREQIAECRRFRHLTQEMIEVGEQLCDAALQVGEGMSVEKKRGSRRSSRPRSRPKSKS